MMTAALGHLGAEVAAVIDAGAEMIHFDVMDGHFAGPLTVGPAFISAVDSRVLKDVHLMVDDPASGIERYVDAGADLLTFHVEAARQSRAVLRRIAEAARSRESERPITRGVALNPSTPLEVVEPLLGDLDYVLVLAVDPGYSGQIFAPSTPGRVERLRRMVESAGVHVAIGVDGGITRDNLPKVAALAPDVIVAGSAIFDGEDAPGNTRQVLALLSDSA
jgi:ribulose-phosphate 3-epimerase